MKFVTILASLVLVLGLAGSASALLTETQTFDSAPADWGTSSVNPSTMGWRSSNNAGGAAAGEAGGDWDGLAGNIGKTEQKYYGDKDIGVAITDADTFSASGVYRLTASGYADNAFLGHFNKVPQAGNVIAVGLYLDEKSGSGPRIYSSIDAVGATVNSATTTIEVAWAGPLRFNYTYDSITRVLTAYVENIANPSKNATLTTGALAADKHFSLDAFGITANQYWDGNNTGDMGDVFIDDVTYSSNVPEPATIAILGMGSLVMLRRRR